MEYIVISFTHKNTDIGTREKLAFNNEVEKEAFLKNILLDVCINEAILLSTCNRIELIFSHSKQLSRQHIDSHITQKHIKTTIFTTISYNSNNEKRYKL